MAILRYGFSTDLLFLELASLHSTMIITEDWEFNILNIYNYKKPSGFHEGYFNFVRENHNFIDGDLLEAGVYRGSSLLGMAMMLKELGSSKKIYGYDTWSGFPPVYRPEDSLDQWQSMFKNGKISERHLQKTRLQASHRSLGLTPEQNLTSANISTSGDFSACSKADLERKIDYLGLDNIILVEGDFSSTMVDSYTVVPESLFAAIIDADLYDSYKVALPFIWQRLSLGGYIYLDEYYSLKFPGARIATDEFFVNYLDKPQPHANSVGHFERWFVRKLFSK